MNKEINLKIIIFERDKEANIISHVEVEPGADVKKIYDISMESGSEVTAYTVKEENKGKLISTFYEMKNIKEELETLKGTEKILKESQIKKYEKDIELLTKGTIFVDKEMNIEKDEFKLSFHNEKKNENTKEIFLQDVASFSQFAKEEYHLKREAKRISEHEAELGPLYNGYGGGAGPLYEEANTLKGMQEIYVKKVSEKEADEKTKRIMEEVGNQLYHQ